LIRQDSLSAEGLVCYRGDQCLFQGLDFTVLSGQLLLIEGVNGSGKTSLLKLIAGLRYPDNGSLLWNGQAIEKMAGEYRRHLTYVGHHDGVKRELTVAENLRLIQQLFSQQEHLLENILLQLNLVIQQDSLAGTLSAGQRRRVALARALYSDASLWILDEPFTSLDKNTTAFFLQALQQHLAQGGMAVMTSHHDINLRDISIQRLDLCA